MVTVERKFQLIKLDAGDWMLPGNTGRTLWRLTRYTEDGSLRGQDGRRIVGAFWSVHRYRYDADHTVRDVENWDHWQTYSTLLPSRDAAIDAALAYDALRAEASGE